MKSHTLWIVLACGMIIPVYGQKVTKTGTTAATFLTIDVGVRGSGMGGAFVSVSDDIGSFYWNPSGIARLNQPEAQFTTVRWIADIKTSHAAVAIPVSGFGTIGADAVFMTTDEMMVTTTRDPEGTGETFSVGSYAVGIAYARSLTDRFSIGFRVKYIQERIYHSQAHGMAFDIGTLFDTQFNGMRIGMSISNYGTKMRMGGRDLLIQTDIDASQHGNNENINAYLQTDAYDLPLLFRVGVSMDLLKGLYNSRLILSIDALHPNDNVESLNVGAEYTFADRVSLRCGYQSLFNHRSEEGLCVGGGIRQKVFGQTVILDYAWNDFGDLPDVQKFSIGLVF